MSSTLTRRAVMGGGAGLGLLTIVSRSGLAADFKFRQFHNQAFLKPAAHTAGRDVDGREERRPTAASRPRCSLRMRVLTARTRLPSRW
jgi:hypothetical protein